MGPKRLPAASRSPDPFRAKRPTRPHHPRPPMVPCQERSTMKKYLSCCAVLVSLLLVASNASQSQANVTLPKVIGSHMVLQRDRTLPIWGWADPEEKVSVQIGDQPAVTTAADKAGGWRVTLPEMRAGGPFTVKIAGKNTITLDDVLVGEVWLCSGQSNMEMAVASCINAQEEIAAANHPQIRHIQVPKLTASVPAKDFPGQWQVCSPETAGGFTACGYFMARELQKKLNVPVGLVHSSWGGTRIEPWTTPAGFAQVPALADIQREDRQGRPALGGVQGRAGQVSRQAGDVDAGHTAVHRGGEAHRTDAGVSAGPRSAGRAPRPAGAAHHALQRDDPSARAVRHPRRDLVPRRIQPRRRQALHREDEGAHQGLASALGERAAVLLRADRALPLWEREPGRAGGVLGSAVRGAGNSQHRHGGHQRHRRLQRHPSEEQAGSRPPASRCWR